MKSPEKLCKNAVCGISNLDIVSGVQNKILEYMQIGLPTIISQKCFDSLNFKRNLDLLVYKNQKEFIKHIINMKINKKSANNISKNCYKKIRRSYKWQDTLKMYNTLI